MTRKKWRYITRKRWVERKWLELPDNFQMFFISFSLLQRVNVTSIQVKGTSNDRLNPGATIFVKFSHETNTPRIRMPSNLLRIVTFSPEHLNNVSSIALWDDKRTLAIVFPNGAYYPRSTTSYQTDDVKLTFNKSPHS